MIKSIENQDIPLEIENPSINDPSNLTYYYESVGITDRSLKNKTSFTNFDQRKNFILIKKEQFYCEFRGSGNTHRCENGYYNKLCIKLYNFLYLEVKFYRSVEKVKYLK